MKITIKKGLVLSGTVMLTLATPTFGGLAIPGMVPKPLSTNSRSRHLMECASPTTIDFNGLARGEYVSNQYSHLGVTFSAFDGFEDKPRIFDTSNPGTAKDGDPDLGSPNEHCTPPGPGEGSGGVPGAEGENCQAQGNILIVEEDGVGNPDDNGGGGTIVIDFNPPAKYFKAMGLLDIDYHARIKVLGASGGQYEDDIDILGDNSFQVKNIELGNIKTIEVTFERSGAITFLEFCPGTTPPATEEPETTTKEAPATTTEAPIVCGAGGPKPSPGQNCGKYSIIPSRDADFNIIEIFNGKTYDDLVRDWTYWAFDRPTFDEWPFDDVDGTLNQVPSGVEGINFLAGNSGGDSCREVTISKDEIIFFPIYNSWWSSFPEDTEEEWYTPFFRYTASYMGLKDPLAPDFEEMNDMFTIADVITAKKTELGLYVNGCKLDPTCDFSVARTVVFPDGAAEVLPPGTFSTAAGYFVALSPLPIGEHTVRFTAFVSKDKFAVDPFVNVAYEFQDFALDVEYKITIV